MGNHFIILVKPIHYFIVTLTNLFKILLDCNKSAVTKSTTANESTTTTASTTTTLKLYKMQEKTLQVLVNYVNKL